MGFSEHRTCRPVPNVIGRGDDAGAETADVFVKNMKTVLGKDAKIEKSVCDFLRSYNLQPALP